MFMLLIDDVIEKAFLELLEKQGTKTSTLEVKNKLRDEGYCALQDHVRRVIDAYYESHDDVVRYQESGHWCYEKALPPDPVLDPTTTLTLNPCPPTHIYSNIQTLSGRSQQDPEWKCQVLKQTNTVFPSVVIQAKTRNQARYRYSQRTGALYTSVTARKNK